jgi:hypothetical protein
MDNDEDLLKQREPVTIAAWTAVGVGVGTALFLGLSMTGLWFYFHANAEIGRTPLPTRFPEPQVQSNPAGDLQALQAMQREQLEGYAWIDRDHGLARIPVARAMEVIAARGAAAYDPLEAPDPDNPLPVRPEAARRSEAGR